MNPIFVCLVVVLVLGMVGVATAAPAATVNESARGIPVAYEVDVVVVGGSSGAVSAAEAAAKAGAKVFLAAPRPYLGEDMCATLRPWLEEGETPTSPLAQRIFSAEAEPSPTAVDPNQYLFQYEADQPSVDRHKDTVPPKRLNDGEWGKPETDSVQYDNDVTIICDLGGPQDVKDVTVLPFYRAGGDFNSESVTISTSDDKKAWKEVGTFKCDRVQGPVALVTTPINARVRYVRFFIKKASDAKRILVGEIRITKPESAVAAAPPPAPEPPKSFVRIAKPLHVKRMLDQALLAAKVDWLTGTYATDVLRDDAGNLCGIVMANRTGRQAVLAKTIIDASDRAWLARTAGAQFAPYPAGPQTFRRTVVGGEPVSGPGVEARKVGLSFSAGQKTYDVYEYTLRLPMADGSFASFAKADQAARDKTFHLAQVDASEVLFQVPPDPMKGKTTAAGPWAGADKVPLDAFRPATVERLYIVGGCADMPREAAEKLVRPLALIDVGARIGAAAAAEAKALPAPKAAKVAGHPARPAWPAVLGPAKPLAPAAPGDTKELLTGIRPTGIDVTQTVASPDRGVPVLGKYDAVVVGAGTGGAPAGIGAARNGARTLVLEYLHGMGGVETLGMIIRYYHGYRGGFTAEIDAGVKALGATNEVVAKNEWFRRENRKAGAEIWYGVLGCGAFVQGGVVKGVIVATPQGRGVVLAKTVIDATGNSDIAAAAGAQTDYTGADDVGVQGAGLPPINLGAAYTNTDYTFADDTDVMDFWHLFVAAREKFKNAYDLGQLVDTRERRRIVGDVTLSPMDMMLNRTWPDTFSMHKSNFDSHGFTVHPIFLLKPPGKDSITVFVPFRALLPKGLDGILVTGLGVSAHRDAIPVIRMQPCVQNQGYAAGTAAAMVAPSAGTVRSVDLRGLQKHLVEKGCLPESVLTDKDNFPLPKERVAQAVQNLCKEHADLAVVLAQPKDSVPLLKEAYAATRADDEKLTFAHVLGMMGDPTGAATLAAHVEAAQTFDKGWNFVGMGQFGMSISPLDSYIIALGRTRDPKAVDVILKKVALLDATKEFSHHRACAMALEAIGDPRAAKPLADLLSKPGMAGHATLSVEDAREKAMIGGGTETKPRNESLRELVVARALYRCGDSGGLGKKILEQYARDLRGHYARHAQAVLAEKKQ